MAWTDITNGTDTDADEVMENFNINRADGLLGEVRMFTLSLTGSLTKANLQDRGWAICDGTTPVSQGITSPTITITPDLQQTFLRMSNDETSGTTGGSDTHQHVSIYKNSSDVIGIPNDSESSTKSVRKLVEAGGSTNIERSGVSITANTGYLTEEGSTVPAYYEVAYFLKVKEVASP